MRFKRISSAFTVAVMGSVLLLGTASPASARDRSSQPFVIDMNHPEVTNNYPPLSGTGKAVYVPGASAGPYYIGDQKVSNHGTSDPVASTDAARTFARCRRLNKTRVHKTVKGNEVDREVFVDGYSWCDVIPLNFVNVDPGNAPYTLDITLTWPGQEKPEVVNGKPTGRIAKDNDLNLYIYEDLTFVYVYDDDPDHSDDNAKGGDPTPDTVEEEDQLPGEFKRSATKYYPEKVTLGDLPNSGSPQDCPNCIHDTQFMGNNLGAENGVACPLAVLKGTAVCPNFKKVYSTSVYYLLVMNQVDKDPEVCQADPSQCNQGYTISTKYTPSQIYDPATGGRSCLYCGGFGIHGGGPGGVGGGLGFGGGDSASASGLPKVKLPGQDGPLETQHLSALTQAATRGPKDRQGDVGAVVGTMIVLIFGSALMFLLFWKRRRRKDQTATTT